MKIEVSKLREFFRKTGKLEEQTWDSNTYVPIKKTIQPDERLDYTNTLENNKLIAEFMEYPDLGIKGDFSYLKYNSSWEWLMPVVEKIEGRIGASILIGRMFCDIKYINPLDESMSFDIRIASGIKMNAVHDAVTKFIKWYNENK